MPGNGPTAAATPTALYARTVAWTAVATFAAESENARPCPGPPATAMSALGARLTPTPSALSCSAVVLALLAITSRLPSPTSTWPSGARLPNALKSPPSCCAATSGAGWLASRATSWSLEVRPESCWGCS